ncbi:MAG: SMC-Scp complex subunit ScpB [Bacilli bacterium]|nr:SMC-Scp complex subunit ScpB [Bacilli bacterium]
MKQVIESLLFIRGDEGITVLELTDILEISEEEIEQLMKSLIEKYKSSDFGIAIEKYGDVYKFVTKKEYCIYIEKLLETDNSNSLTSASLEALAIIAYNQPMTRTQVDEIRGVNSSHLIRKLVNCGLIKENGKSDLPGRPNLYVTTPSFLDHFGLNDLASLPKMDDVPVTESDEVDLFKSKFYEITPKNN